MLDRQVVREFLQENLKDVEIPEGISFDDLVEIFCRYTEDILKMTTMNGLKIITKASFAHYLRTILIGIG